MRADPNGGRGRGALGLIVPLTLHDQGPEFGTGRGETDVVLGSEGGQFCEGCAVFFSVALPEQEAVRSRCLGFMRVSPVFLTAGAVEWSMSRSRLCSWLRLSRPADCGMELARRQEKLVSLAVFVSWHFGRQGS